VQFNFKKRTNVFYRHALISETVSGFELAQREDLLQASTSRLRWLGRCEPVLGTRPNYFRRTISRRSSATLTWLSAS
jgi:hypothetical protein